MSLKVTVTGIEHVTATLGKMGQVVGTDMHQAFDQVGRMMQRVARSEVPEAPLSNWGAWNAIVGRRINVSAGRETSRRRNLSFSKSKAVSGLDLFVTIKKKGPQRIELGAYVGNRDPAGSIYELAGSRMDKSTKAVGGSALFRQNLNKRYSGKRFPRVLYPAQQKADSWGVSYLERALQQSVSKVQSMMDRG